tara:strand:- start:294 stop:1136 length:843 start_codon:yes stop_codon:yes gene_type:complete
MEQFKKIGINCNIKANNIEIGKNVIIGDNVNIVCDTFKLGDNTILGSNININCKSFISDEWLFMWDGVEVGRGGSYGPNSNVKIGKHVGIFEKTMINPSDSVTIGDDVGIGGEVMIWTHGAWLDVMQGFPSDFGPVSIGNNVWLPARSIVLPNVEIGDNTVIGIGSVVNKSIPSGSLAAGSPCKVIKENYYPRELNESERTKIVWGILEDWYKLHEMKGINARAKYKEDQITLIQKNNKTIFNLTDKTITGFENEVSEDLRDYLRRRGIKIFTKNQFKSI